MRPVSTNSFLQVVKGTGNLKALWWEFKIALAYFCTSLMTLRLNCCRGPFVLSTAWRHSGRVFHGKVQLTRRTFGKPNLKVYQVLRNQLKVEELLFDLVNVHLVNVSISTKEPHVTALLSFSLGNNQDLFQCSEWVSPSIRDILCNFILVRNLIWGVIIKFCNFAHNLISASCSPLDRFQHGCHF